MSKTKTSKSKKEETPNPKQPFLKDERVRFIAGLLTIFISIYIFVSFVSYLFTWKADQSLAWSNLWTDSRVAAHNWTGKLGAMISVQFMNHWFGLASIALTVILFLFGLKLLKLYRGKMLMLSFKLIIGVLLFSIITGFLFGVAGGFLGSGIGGTHGLFMSDFLTSIFGIVGVALILLIALVVYIIFIKPSSYSYFKAAATGIAQLFKRKPKEKEENPNEADSQKEAPVQPLLLTDIDEADTPAKPEIIIPIKPEPEPEVQPEMSNIFDFEQPSGTNGRSQPQADAGKEIGFEISKEFEDEESVKIDDVAFTIEKTDEESSTEGDIERGTTELYDPTLDLSHYQLPPIELLEDYPNTVKTVSDDILISNKNKIVDTLQNYKIQIDKIKATIGPTVTLYEIVPAPGVRISKIKNLEDDIALSLAALGIRIIAPIPGKGTIGIEVPNEHPEIVSMHSILKSQKFQENKFNLAIALGKTITNEIYVLDLAKLPHLLVAGATGQGKSVGLNAIIASLLYKKHPSEIKFVLIDPKKVELSIYSKLEHHFLAKLPDSEETIITDTQKVVNTLNSLCKEMDQRYDLLKMAGAKMIKEYNDKFISRRLNPNKGHRFLPYIVVVIDEFADLIMTAGREVETPIARLAQLARAIGIHLIIATQRPSANIITGIIKANFPARIAFRVSSSIDSRTILDHSGANNLIGRGDMLVSVGSDMVRVQCAFIDTPEIERITDFIGNQQGYPTAFELPEYAPEGAESAADVDLKKRDDLFDDAARMVVLSQMGSTSQIQRKFSIGYNRAGRIMDQLEAAGIVGPFEGSKARQVLIVDEVSLEQILNSIAQRG